MFNLQQIESDAKILYLSLCKQHKINPLLLTIKTRVQEDGDKGGYDGNKIEIFIHQNDSIDDIMFSVKHEFRHHWQDVYHHDVCEWWRKNYRLYEALARNEKLNGFCFLEIDANYFAMHLKSHPDFDKIFSIDYLNQLKDKAVSSGFLVG